MPQQTFSAFFSYSREDSDFALKLARDLKDHGAAVWLDQLDIRPGQHWDSAVESALANCPNMLLVLSPSSVVSDNVMDEVSFALDEQKLIVPVLYCNCKIPFRLRRVQYVDARTEYDKALEELLQLLAGTETAEAERAARKKEQQERLAAEKQQAEAASQGRKAADETSGAARAFEAAPTNSATKTQAEQLPQATGTVKQVSREAGIPPPTKSSTRYWIAASVASVLILISVGYFAATRSADTAKERASEIPAVVNAPTAPSKSDSPATQTPPLATKTFKPDTTVWAQGFLKAMEGPQADGLHAFFEETVSPYYSLPSAGWDAIRKDKENFFNNFPTIQYTLIGKPTEDAESEDRVALGMDILYSAIKQNGQHSQGKAHLSMELQLVDGQWKITAIREKVSK